MVGGDGLDVAPTQGFPQEGLLALVPDGGRADVPGRLGIILVEVHAVVQQQVLGAGLHVDLLAPVPGVLDFLQRFLVGQVDDDHGGLRCLGDAQQAGDRLRLQIGRPGQGMAGRGELPAVFPLGDHAVDDPGVLAVDAADAAQGFQLLQRPVHIPVAHHHGGIGHVHFERGDALGEHIRQFRPDGLVPVVDGHVEAVVAEGPSVGLLVPQVQAIMQALALVGAGEVDDGGGAAPERRPAAGVEIIRRGGVAHIQVKVGVGVDEAGEQQAPGHIHHPVDVRFQIFPRFHDFLIFYQQVGPLRPRAGDHRAAFEQRTHKNRPPFLLMRPV